MSEPAPSLTDEFLLEIEADMGIVIRDLIAQPVSGPEELRVAVPRYLDRIRKHVASGVNVAVAKQVAERCLGLLSQRWETDSEEWRLVQAGVRYFLEEEDASFDMESPAGFDDDLRVIKLVAAIAERRSPPW